MEQTTHILDILVEFIVLPHAIVRGSIEESQDPAAVFLVIAPASLVLAAI